MPRRAGGATTRTLGRKSRESRPTPEPDTCQRHPRQATVGPTGRTRGSPPLEFAHREGDPVAVSEAERPAKVDLAEELNEVGGVSVPGFVGL
jgi:hypothetical protein